MIYARYAEKSEIGKIIFDKEIYDRISDDKSPDREDFQIPRNNVSYIGGYVDGIIVSLFIVHGKKLHFMVLKKFRVYANELLKASFALWPRNVYVEIPTLYRSVINFAKNFGFKEIGVDKKSHLKNGKLYDCHKLSYEVKHGIC